MYESQQSIIERVQDQAAIHGWDVSEQNIQLVIAEGVREVRGRVPANVRKALNSAVKDGRLMHMKKDGAKPEIYCRPQSEFVAKELRGRRVIEQANALKAFCEAGK